MCGNDRSVDAIDTRQNYSKIASLSDDELMGQLVVELLEVGKALNRKSLCARLLVHIELSETLQEEQRYQKLMKLVLETHE